LKGFQQKISRMPSTAHAESGEPGHGESLVGGYTGQMLLSVSLGWAVIQTGRLGISPLLPLLTEDLAITELQAGMALSVMWGVYALLQFPGGRLSDRLSRKTMLVPGITIVAGGFGLLVSAGGYPLFVGSLALIGFGAGLYPAASRALLSDLFVERRGTAFGIHSASSSLGGVLAAGLGVLAVQQFGWRPVLVPVVVVGLLAALIIHFLNRESYRLERVSFGTRGTLGRLWTRRFRRLLVAYGLYVFVWQGAVSFLPTYLQARDLSAGFASGSFALLFVVGAVCKPLAGRLGDRFPRPLVASAALILGAASLVALVVVDSLLLLVPAVVCFAAGFMSYPPVMQAYIMDALPDESMGGDFGMVRTAYISFGALGPTYVGFVASRASYDLAFLGLAGMLVVATGIVGWLAWTR
jgi:MFS family permease